MVNMEVDGHKAYTIAEIIKLLNWYFPPVCYKYALKVERVVLFVWQARYLYFWNLL